MGDWDQDGWVILRLTNFTMKGSGFYDAHHFYLQNLWRPLQDPVGSGTWSNHQILPLDHTWDMWGLKTCRYVWYAHLELVLDLVAKGLEMKAGDVRAYELSLLQNDGLVNNQSLRHNCFTLKGLPDTGDPGDQKMQEKEDNLDNGEWCKLPLSQLGKHRRG